MNESLPNWKNHRTSRVDFGGHLRWHATSLNARGGVIFSLDDITMVREPENTHFLCFRNHFSPKGVLATAEALQRLAGP